MPDFASTAFFLAVLQIIAIDIVLSGDNAVVIALACRGLPEHLRRRGIFWGVFAAAGLRVVLTACAALLMGLPMLKLAGGVLLLWIGVKLLLPEGEGAHEVTPHDHLWGAVRTITVADFVMSVDNVIAVAGASHGSLLLLVFGLLVSIPLIVWSSQVLLHLMERFPFLITLGAALMGYVAGTMIVTDPVLALRWAEAARSGPVAGALGAVLVVALARLLARGRKAKNIEIL